MPRIPTLEHDQAPADVRAVYADFHTRMSFPAAPNFIRTQGHSGTVVQATWDLVRNVLVHGQIPRYVKEMMFAAISRDRQCRYCEAAHIACCRLLGVNPKLIDAMIYDIESMHDHKMRDIIMFGIQCSRNPQSLTEDDFQMLKEHGLGHSEIIEVIAMSALAVYANIIADATMMEPDAMFEQLTRSALPGTA